MSTFAFVDASNLFYGGEKSLGWKVDYQKLLGYLKEKYGASEIFYFGGVEIYDFPYNYLENETVPLAELEKHLIAIIKTQNLNEAGLLLIGKHLQRVRFYRNLERFGYKLFLKPVKLYEHEDGSTRRKANCDVEMAFHLMKEQYSFKQVVILSGDGDFLPVLKYLRATGRKVVVLARGPRTAKEIKQFAGSDFRDFEYLKNRLKWEK
ncbi:MAG: NYN domain-containing protein [Candidatus Jorgensenbacteria bacterium]